MTNLILLLIPLLFLSSCTIDWNNEKDKKIMELEKQVAELKEKNDDDLFKKKQECFGYKDKLIKELKEKTNTTSSNYYSLDELFYSPNQESCIIKISESLYSPSAQKSMERYMLRNLLTGESLGSATWNCSEIFTEEKTRRYCEEKLEEFDKKIQELKGK